ncbi:MAG: ATP-binding cassette domain-containing protein [Gammaproteobacteria bacterium]|nr:ATP-binding cassette domain-containing protein [Gammaproteobacteria bacterium]
MNEGVIVCEHLSRTYREGGKDLQVLRDTNLVVQASESVAITGTSGSGKTTLLNLLGGIDKPTSGHVFILGQDVSDLTGNDLDLLRNRTLGFVYQFHHLLGEFSALENTAMPLLIGKRPFAEAMERAAVILGKVGLSERLEHKPAQLSGGERQRVAIARALINEPACVLMDEPTGNLDGETAAGIQRLMQTLKTELTTSFIVVTHDMAFAAQMDTGYQLINGELGKTTSSETTSGG